ncbi:hypothetical protein DYH09_10720 [bacterium CPR1]|nr:hypothetical protein [bacterium CPR1]
MDWFEQKSSPPSLRRRGLEIKPGLVLRTSQQPDGNWAAWVEEEGAPVVADNGKPRLFLGASSYGAQCEAIRWLRQSGATAPAPGPAPAAAPRRRLGSATA